MSCCHRKVVSNTAATRRESPNLFHIALQVSIHRIREALPNLFIFLCTSVKLNWPFRNGHLSCCILVIRYLNPQHHEETVWLKLERHHVLVILDPQKKEKLKKKGREAEFKMAICRTNIVRNMKVVQNLLVLIEQINNVLRTIWYIHTIQLHQSVWPHQQHQNGPFGVHQLLRIVQGI